MILAIYFMIVKQINQWQHTSDKCDDEDDKKKF